MFYYRVFGGTFRSEIEFPDLHTVEGGSPRWTLRRSAEPGAGILEVLGEDQIEKGVHVRLVRIPGGLALAYSDSGRFDITDGGREITWRPGENARLEDARLDVTGRVLATAMHLGGMLCLHGSAVAIDGGAVAFLAPKFHGKSTLALALTRAGARLLTDDALPVELVSPLLAWPGVHSIRLWNDSAARFVGAAQTLPAGSKHLVSAASESRVDVPVPLSAIYLLHSAPVGTEPVIVRHRVPAVGAAVSLVAHEKGGAVMRGALSGEVLDRCVRVADQVPVYALRIARDYDRLDEVVTQLLEWHAAPALTAQAE